MGYKPLYQTSPFKYTKRLPIKGSRLYNEWQTIQSRPYTVFYVHSSEFAIHKFHSLSPIHSDYTGRT